MLEAGADPNTVSEGSGSGFAVGMTPLLAASSWGKVDEVRLLIAAGADLHVRTPNMQQTAMHLVAGGNIDSWGVDKTMGLLRLLVHKAMLRRCLKDLLEVATLVGWSFCFEEVSGHGLPGFQQHFHHFFCSLLKRNPLASCNKPLTLRRLSYWLKRTPRGRPHWIMPSTRRSVNKQPICPACDELVESAEVWQVVESAEVDSARRAPGGFFLGISGLGHRTDGKEEMSKRLGKGVILCRTPISPSKKWANSQSTSEKEAGTKQLWVPGRRSFWLYLNVESRLHFCWCSKLGAFSSCGAQEPPVFHVPTDYNGCRSLAKANLHCLPKACCSLEVEVATKWYTSLGGEAGRVFWCGLFSKDF